MKKPMIFLGAILVFALVAAIIALTAGSRDNITGTYVLKGVSGSGSEMFKVSAGDVTLEIAADHTGTLSMMGQETPVTVNTDENKISFNGGTDYTPYVLDGGKLTVEHNGYKAVFKKK